MLSAPVLIAHPVKCCPTMCQWNLFLNQGVDIEQIGGFVIGKGGCKNLHLHACVKGKIGDQLYNRETLPLRGQYNYFNVNPCSKKKRA